MNVRQPESLIGRRYGRLVVIAPAPRLGRKHARWWCVCDCGRQKDVDGYCLTLGTTRSCGCLRAEVTKARMTTHGDNRVGQRHPLYKIWAGILRRCDNPHERNYERYGARGITVCDRWRVYENFKADMGPTFAPGLSIERANNSGNYEPDNCTWATRKQQCRNRRSNHFVTYKGETKTIAEWAEIVQLAPERISTRLRAGWSPERALTDTRLIGWVKRRTDPNYISSPDGQRKAEDVMRKAS